MGSEELEHRIRSVLSQHLPAHVVYHLETTDHPFVLGGTTSERYHDAGKTTTYPGLRLDHSHLGRDGIIQNSPSLYQFMSAVDHFRMVHKRNRRHEFSNAHPADLERERELLRRDIDLANPLRSVDYHYGMLLGVEATRAEQAYHRQRMNAINTGCMVLAPLLGCPLLPKQKPTLYPQTAKTLKYICM